MKISICTINGLTSHDIISQYEKYSDRLQIKVSGEVWLDAAHKCSNKGVALKFLQNELKITKDNTMAFGDFMNDIEMLMNAKYSFAMANALPAVKDVAKYMTDTNDNKGVFKILTQIIE